MNYNVIDTSDFKVSKLLTAFFQQQSSDRENYHFGAILTNSAGISLNVTFNVQCQTSSDQKTLTGYQLQGVSSSQSDVLVANYASTKQNQLEIANCNQISGSQLQTDSETKGAVQFGADHVVKNVVRDESLSDSDFKVQDLVSVYREVVDNQSYKVVARLVNSVKTTIDCSYSLNYLSTGAQEVTSYSYIIY